MMTTLSDQPSPLQYFITPKNNTSEDDRIKFEAAISLLSSLQLTDPSGMVVTISPIKNDVSMNGDKKEMKLSTVPSPREPNNKPSLQKYLEDIIRVEVFNVGGTFLNDPNVDATSLKISRSKLLPCYNELYTILNKATKDPRIFYDHYKSCLTTYINANVIPFLSDVFEGTHTDVPKVTYLHKLLRGVQSYNFVVGELKFIYAYLERYYIPNRKLSNLSTVATQLWESMIVSQYTING
jgi:hypothetical protein